MNLSDRIEKLNDLKSDLSGKDFLLTWEKSETDLKVILEVAAILKEMRSQNISPKYLIQAWQYPISGITQPAHVFHLHRQLICLD